MKEFNICGFKFKIDYENNKICILEEIEEYHIKQQIEPFIYKHVKCIRSIPSSEKYFLIYHDYIDDDIDLLVEPRRKTKFRIEKVLNGYKLIVIYKERTTEFTFDKNGKHNISGYPEKLKWFW